MTTTQLRREAPQSPRFIRALGDFFASGDFTALIIVLVLLLVPPLSLAVADWPLDMGVIIPVTVTSLFFGLILANSQFNELLALIISITYGFCLVLLIAAINLGGPLGNNVYEVFIRTAEWIAAIPTDEIRTDDLVFTLLVAALFWFLGYNAAWHTFRIDRVWRVILPPGLILMTNSIFYEGEQGLGIYLVLFFFAALLLVVRSNLEAREWDWIRNGIQPPRNLRRQFLRAGAILALVALLAGWAVPSGDLQERLDRFQQFLQSEPLTQLSEFWNRLFSPIEARGPTTADYYGGDSLELGGAIRLGDQTVFLVEAPLDRRYYWRSRVFDTYENGRWTPAASIRLTDRNQPFEVELEPDQARVAVDQTFTVALNGTRLLYAAPQPLRISEPGRADLFYTYYSIEARENEAIRDNDPRRAMSVSVIRPVEVVRRGETYDATSMMSVATAFDLRAATTDYPQWVSDLYLYISPSVTERTIDLAQQIVTETGATNPYDQAKAIEAYLRANIIYNESIPRPPANQDPVDWLLFDYQQGYCNYYASAMIVMLRSLGIPARMAAGFAQGTYNAEEGAFVVTERDAHTWVEAYFPGYGWIEFEPTAAQARLDREGDELFSQQSVTQAQATPTPTATQTPFPTATIETTPTPPPPDNQGAADVPTATPTITPTFTPSPTATPVIVPTQPSPIQPEPQSPLGVILPALGVLLLGLLLLVLIAAIVTFIWWWWEWRGMGGLSPIARAYARLERYVRLIGMRLGSQETPEERRKTIVRGLPQAERPVTAITRLYTTERYGPGDKHPAQGERNANIADRAWTDARGQVLGRWLRRRLLFWRRD